MRSAVRVRAPRPPTRVRGNLSAGVTQSVEFLPSKQAVAGSSPVSRSSPTSVSLHRLHKPVQRNWPGRETFLCVEKSVQRHPAHLSGGKHVFVHVPHPASLAGTSCLLSPLLFRSCSEHVKEIVLWYPASLQKNRLLPALPAVRAVLRRLAHARSARNWMTPQGTGFTQRTPLARAQSEDTRARAYR